MLCAVLLCTSICYKYHTSPQTLYTFDAATVQRQPAALQAFPCATAMDGASACVWVCAASKGPTASYEAVGSAAGTLKCGAFLAYLFSLCYLLLLSMYHPRPPCSLIYVVASMVQQPHFKVFSLWPPRTVPLCVCVSVFALVCHP